MKFKKFMFKLLRLKVMVPILIVIIAGIILLTYFFGGIKASAIDLGKNNIQFDFSAYTSKESEEYNKEEVLSGKYIKWYAQNDKFVMYYDEASTIIYIYQIEAAALTGSKVKHDGEDYPEVDITKCKCVFQTAKNELSTADGANFLIKYADSKTGQTIINDFNTMTNSVFYMNPLTEEIEHHYFIQEKPDGNKDTLRIFYAIGNFSAGDKYFPQKMYQTIYKPYGEPFENEPTLYSEDPEAFEKAKESWIKYMEALGLPDAWDASDAEVNAALAKTYEQRFRGNALLKMKTIVNNTTKKATYSYQGSVTLYTEEGYNYMLKLIDEGEITADEIVEFGFDEANTASSEFKYGNAFWRFTNVSENFFEGEGQYFNCQESPIIINTAIPSKFFEQDLGYGPTGGFAYATTQDDETGPYKYYYIKGMSGFIKSSIYSMLYKNDTVWEDSTFHLSFENAETHDQYIAGGFLKVDEDGYVYGDDGKIEKTVYTLTTTQDDNDLFKIPTNTSLPVFGFAVDFKLTNDGLQTTILADSIIDCTNAKDHSEVELNIAGIPTKIADINKQYEILNITILPQLATTVSSKSDPVNGDDGYMIIPDGSGAIINFGNGKYELGYEGVNKGYYGSDNAFATKAKPEDTKDLMLGMFGYICTTEGRERGVIGIIDQGGSQNTLLANTTNLDNHAYFQCMLRRNQEVRIGKGSGAKTFYKLAKVIAELDMQYTYLFLNENQLDYSTVAKVYQDYLIRRDFGVENTKDAFKDETTETVVDLNFLGSFEKYALFLGFKYKVADSLTTFDQAQDIIEELTTGVEVNNESKKIQNYSVSYTAWTDEEMEYEVGGSIKVNSVLGGLSSMTDFANFLNTNGKSLYLQTKVTSTKGFDFSFGATKYDARNVANALAVVNEYDPSTLRQDKKLSETNYINPIYYISVVNYVVGKMEKIDKKAPSTAYYLDDLGNNTTNSYQSGDEVYGGSTVEYQKASLAELTKNGKKVKINAPYDYTFKYISEATNIPMTSTLSPIFDEAIPFYQLVISGLFDYTTEDINGTSNNSAKWFYSKALETGSNLSFVISAENPNVLLETDYTYYYQAYYMNWKETIVDYASKIDAIGIHRGQLAYHQAIGKNIAFVQYKISETETISLCVNTTGSDFVVADALTINGVEIAKDTVIPAYNFYKVA